MGGESNDNGDNGGYFKIRVSCEGHKGIGRNERICRMYELVCTHYSYDAHASDSG